MCDTLSGIEVLCKNTKFFLIYRKILTIKTNKRMTPTRRLIELFKGFGRLPLTFPTIHS